jgi:ABC-2 type transport system permease protein
LAGFKAALERELIIKLKSRFALIISIAIPSFYLLLFGVSMNEAFKGYHYQGKIIPFLRFATPGVAVLAVLWPSLILGVSIYMERSQGMFEELVTCPIKRINLLLGKVIANTTVSICQVFLVIVLGLTISGANLVEYWIEVLASLLIAMIASIGFGSLSLTLSSRTKSVQTFNILINLINLPIVFTSSAFYPVETMPIPLRYIAKFNPATFTADIIRWLLLGYSDLYVFALEFLSLISFSLIMFGIALYTFQQEIEVT